MSLKSVTQETVYDKADKAIEMHYAAHTTRLFCFILYGSKIYTESTMIE